MSDDPLFEVLKVFLSPAVTFAGFWYTAKQLTLAQGNYRTNVESYNESLKKTAHEQRWKKAEFIAKEAREFYADKRVERVVYMLDWGVRQFKFEEFGPTNSWSFPITAISAATQRRSHTTIIRNTIASS